MSFCRTTLRVRGSELGKTPGLLAFLLLTVSLPTALLVSGCGGKTKYDRNGGFDEDARASGGRAGASDSEGPLDGDQAGSRFARDAVLLATGKEVVALATNETHLYWVESGKKDELGNTDDGGSLWGIALEGDTANLVASDLFHPTTLDCSLSYAYMTMSDPPGGAREFHAVDLKSGDAFFLHTGRGGVHFAGAREVAFWRDTEATTLFFHSEKHGLEKTGARGEAMATDGTQLLFVDDEGLRSSTARDGLDALEEAAPVGGGRSPELLGLWEGKPVITEYDKGKNYLSVADDDGWTRVAALQSEPEGRFTWPRKLLVRGDRYFVSISTQGDEEFHQILTGRLDDDDTSSKALFSEKGRPLTELNQDWTGSLDTFFYTDGKEIFRVSLRD